VPSTRRELCRRETCLAWSAAHLLLGLPLNYFMLPKAPTITASREGNGKPHIPLDRRMIVLGFAFVASWMVVAAMAVHLLGRSLRTHPSASPRLPHVRSVGRRLLT
jgi:hypothetical protein